MHIIGWFFGGYYAATLGTVAYFYYQMQSSWDESPFVIIDSAECSGYRSESESQIELGIF